MKQCFKCGKSKPLDSFYRHPQMGDGLLGKCKTCTKKDVAENYRVNRDHYAAYEKARSQTSERKAGALRYQQKSRLLRPGRYRCATAVSNAVRDGRIVKMPCEKCGSIKVQAHHEDYRRPLVVRWLCRKHHLDHHKKVAY